MKTTLFVAALVWAALGHSPAIAESAPQTMTAEATVQIALAGNRDLAAARVRVEEVRARLQQASLWPNPEIDIQGRSDDAFNNHGEYGVSARLNQPFSVSGRIGAGRAVAQVEIDRAVAALADRERLIIRDVRRAFTELLALEQQISLQKFLVGLNEDLLEAVNGALKAAQVSEKDVNAVRITLMQARQRKTLLDTQRRSRVLELNRLMGRSPDLGFTPAGDLAVLLPTNNIPSLTLESALKKRPDYAAVQLDISAARAEERLAKAERFEDWRVGVGYEQEKTVVDGAPPQGVSRFVAVGLTIPLPLFDRKQGRIRETIAAQSRAEQSVEALRLQIKQELADARNRIETLAPLLDAYAAGILKQAEENVKLVENGYRQGQVGIVEVIQTRQQFAELKSGYIDTMREYQLAVIDLDIAAGVFPSASQSGSSQKEKSP